MTRHKTLCFSGPRPQNFSFDLDGGVNEYLALRADVWAVVMVAWGQGFRVFMCGMAQGFDLICGEIAAELLARPGYGPGHLTTVRPFAGHGFSGRWGECNERVLIAAGRVVTLAPAYHPQAYYQRNLYLVENSSRLICYQQGWPGGTGQTVTLARQHGLDIINLV